MRILNIYYKNINSLEGEGRLDFAHGPIADSGVFAITGPNGSGKSSILDVITLGLYGETFRFDKPAEHIITKHASESRAEVEFSFGGELYRSSWQVNRADTSKPEMTLSLLNGDPQLLADSPGLVRRHLAELTGMDFHKFSKSIVLPQGDFAAFLNALDSERMDILEKISGNDYYADFRQAAELKHSELQNRVSLLEQESGLLPILPDEAYQAAEQDYLDFKEIRTELKSGQAALTQQLQELQNLSVLEIQHRQILDQQKALEQQINQHEQELERIRLAGQTGQFQNDLALLEKYQADILFTQGKLYDYRNELAVLQQDWARLANNEIPETHGRSLETQKKLLDELKLKISELKLELSRETDSTQAIKQQLTDKSFNLEEVETWLQAHQADATLLENFPEVAQLRNLRTELQELTVEQKKQSAWSKKMTGNLGKSKSALSATENRLKELDLQIATNLKIQQELAQGKSFAELKDLLQDQQARVKDFQELFTLATLNARFSEKKGLFSWFSGNKQTDEIPDITELQSRLNDLKLEQSKEENINRALEQAIANETLLKKLASHRSELVEGKPCFLCGSTTHPYSLKPPVLGDSKKALADQRGKSLVLKSSIETLEKQLAAAEKKSTQLTAKQKFLQEKRSEWTLLSNRLNVAREKLDINNLSMQKGLLAEETAELEKLTNLVNEYAKLERDIAKARNEIENKQAGLISLRSTTETLDADWTQRSPEVTELEQKYQKCLADEKALSAQLEKQLSAYGEKLPKKNKENALFDRLNSRRQDYQIRQLRQTGLREEILNLQEKLQECQASILAHQKQLTSAEESLDRESALMLHLNLTDKQLLSSAEERALNEKQQTLNSLQQVISAKIAEHGFKSLNELIELQKLVEREPEIRNLIQEKTQHLQTIIQQIHALESQIQQSTAHAGETTEAELAGLQKELAAKLDIAEMEIRTLEIKLDKQDEYRQKFQAIDAELSELRKELLAAGAVVREINEEPGGLRRNIQQLLIDKLLSQANQILEKISGRYYLRNAASAHGLALEIEDTRQKNVRRLPKTLSGGESFVVSLALALALAEIANNGKSIESLFLDEGFGNLDAEALYLAMTALENLKIQGKTVGVISHVEAVKKRIKTQIELVKKANGLSELRLVA